MLLTILTALVFLSGALAVRAEARGARVWVYLFKPLTVVLILVIACLPKFPVSQFYRYAVIAGLVCSLTGDVFLMLPSDRFVEGLASFLVAHVFYIAAFTFEGARGASVWGVLPFLIYGGLMWRALSPHLGRMKVAVAVYMLAILLMGGQALNRWLTMREAGSLLALGGALLFVASDSLLAVNRFRKPFRHAQSYVLGTYFAAQWLIALST